MRILHIASRVPYPLIDGARIVMHQLIVALVRLGHDVTVVAVDDQKVDAEPLRRIVDLHVEQIPVRPRAIGALGSLFSDRPFSQVRRDRSNVYTLLDHLHARKPFGVVIADQAHIAQYGAYVKQRYGIPYILRSHNVEHEIYRRHLSTVTNWLMRRYVAMQTMRWERFERSQHAMADYCLAITDRDAETIARFAPDVPVATIPAAVDLCAFPYHDPDERESDSVVLLGNMGWPPNRNAVLWFTEQVLPHLRRSRPSTVVHLIGENPPVDELPAQSETFRIHGRVDSIAPFYSRVAVGLVPLNVGGGMRVKMLEMMASGLPVVATRLGAEGNRAEAGRHYLSADTPDAFAGEVVRLLTHPGLRSELARSARAFVEDAYSLDSIAGRIEEILHHLVEKRINA